MVRMSNLAKNPIHSWPRKVPVRKQTDLDGSAGERVASDDGEDARRQNLCWRVTRAANSVLSSVNVIRAIDRKKISIERHAPPPPAGGTDRG